MQRALAAVGVLALVGACTGACTGDRRDAPPPSPNPPPAAKPRPVMPPPDAAVVGDSAADLPDWTEVHTLDDLRQEVSRAARRGRPVIVHVRAHWALPSYELEAMYKAPKVARELARFARLYIDVTEATDNAEEVLSQLAVEELPAALVFRDARGLAGFLSGRRGTRPEPTNRITSAPAGREFLASMGR